jgi:nitrogen PTS system EIIA component
VTNIDYTGFVMQLNISQAASLLGTSEAMLTRWARQGAIPAQESENTFFFYRKDLEAWATRRHISLREPDGPTPPEVVKAPSLFDAMASGGCIRDIPGADAISFLTNLVDAVTLPDVNRATLLDRVLEREALSSTGIGNGIAIPHPRQPIESLSSSIIVTCFPSQPVNFNSVDGQGVSVAFLMLSVDTPAHLKLLSQLSYVLHQPDNAAFFRSAPPEDEVMALLQRQCRDLVE